MPTTYEQLERELRFAKNYIAEIQQKLHFCMNNSINLKSCMSELEEEKRQLDFQISQYSDEVERLKMYLTDIVMAGPEDGGVLTDLARMALNPAEEESNDSVAEKSIS